MAYFLSPINDQQCDANGNPLSGGKVYTYLAGTSTAAATYTDSTSGTQQANPIILNASGLPASPIWMLGGFPLKFIIKDSADTTIRTVDNVSGINDTSSTASEWTDSGLTPTYISATSFSVTGDQTAIFQVNRRVRTRNTGGLIYSRISAVAYGAVTTVTVVNDSGVIDSGLTTVSYGFLSYSPSSVPYALYAAAGANTDITSVSSTVINSKIQPITASVAANALTITLNPTTLDFRSSTLTSGSINTRQVSAAISVVISSGSTLGTVSAQQSRIAVLAIDNAGTVELAAVNISGGTDLTETGVISTTAEGGAGAADSATVIYSTTARTGVAYRIVGYVESTQATAGTWATAPSTIQGYGGQAFAAMSSLGYGQVYSAPTRAISTTYYNTSGKPRLVLIGSASGVISVVTLSVSGFGVAQAYSNTNGNGNLCAIVPPGASYILSITSGTPSVSFWNELG